MPTFEVRLERTAHVTTTRRIVAPSLDEAKLIFDESVRSPEWFTWVFVKWGEEPVEEWDEVGR